MNFTKKQILTIIFLLVFSVSFSQTAKKDSLRGEFTYLLQYKPNTLNRDYIIKELYSLQISDSRSFFISENRLKFDSLFMVKYNKNKNQIDLSNIPVSRSNFLIIQTNDNSQFYESIGMTLLSYNSPVIDNWKLIDETKMINSIACKKAELQYKGRGWTAWYATKIPFSYGPYKFSGLPGLIVKITDKTGDYDFELVKSISSSKLKGKMTTVSERYYQNAKLVTKKDLSQARTNFRDNAKYQLESMGTVFFQDQKEKQKISETEKKGHNPIELED
ncbi:GLPGLI family protein [Chryseobacterium ginsenosidimutans]|uniref:GLPGLI family protein n=1 Tax=Chryseobacterium ginsenosidimutans TaxID=687846 RepID=UPI0021671112|nr:GLPGLI family protein [Chryseobacterium ginsenosidimutans]MCS3869976.1 GLPGLI family protein [Chryseobacterium ginsenosidimutans]